MTSSARRVASSSRFAPRCLVAFVALLAPACVSDSEGSDVIRSLTEVTTGERLDVPERTFLLGSGAKGFLLGTRTEDAHGWLVPVTVGEASTTIGPMSEIDTRFPFSLEHGFDDAYQRADGSWVIAGAMCDEDSTLDDALDQNCASTREVHHVDLDGEVERVGRYDDISYFIEFVGEFGDGDVLVRWEVVSAEPATLPGVVRQLEYARLDLSSGELATLSWQPEPDVSNPAIGTWSTAHSTCLVDDRIVAAMAVMTDAGPSTTIVIADPTGVVRGQPRVLPGFLPPHLVCNLDGPATLIVTDREARRTSPLEVLSDGSLVDRVSRSYAENVENTTIGQGAITFAFGERGEVHELVTYSSGSWNQSPELPIGDEIVSATGDGRSYLGATRTNGEVTFRTWRA